MTGEQFEGFGRVVMWCSACQQDVPGIASTDSEGGMCCATCGQAIASESENHSVAELNTSVTDVSHLAGPPPVDLEDWELDEDLRAVDRIVKKVHANVGTSADESTADTADPAFDAILTWHDHLKHPPALPSDGVVARPKSAGEKRKPKTSFLSWAALSLGLMAFVCGGVLLIWSLATGRGDLWSLGLPLALGGQAALLIGVVFQMDGLWQNNRQTSQTLGELDESLSDLRHTTTMLGTTNSSAAQSFYAHMAEGASPHLMLADLKGQLDVLAVKMGRDRA